uniref:NPH3 domain-containing protein n=1 Tax=Oryza sativa subsp. japonica TaxID=39947 RepID=Q6ZIQ3_ORYSJ|nr:unknown protein [Oryza sativa Japonica Group]
MRARFAHDHDLMYTIVDHYLQNHRGKLTEEEKSRVCYNVNCTKLSHHLFMHLVQNPRLPLRFVVQAMLVEQLHSHHSMLLSGGHHHHAGAAGAPSSAAPPASLLKSSLSGAFGACGGFAATAAAAGDAASSMTLGDILQRDAVLRQSAHIRASMQATTQRIDSLERELAGLRTRLRRVITKDTTNTRGLKSRLVLGFKNLFGRRPVTAAAAAPPTSGERAAARVSVNDKAMSTDAPELDADADADELTRPHRRNLSIV